MQWWSIVPNRKSQVLNPQGKKSCTTTRLPWRLHTEFRATPSHDLLLIFKHSRQQVVKSAKHYVHHLVIFNAIEVLKLVYMFVFVQDLFVKLKWSRMLRLPPSINKQSSTDPHDITVMVCILSFNLGRSKQNGPTTHRFETCMPHLRLGISAISDKNALLLINWV